MAASPMASHSENPMQMGTPRSEISIAIPDIDPQPAANLGAAPEDAVSVAVQAEQSEQQLELAPPMIIIEGRCLTTLALPLRTDGLYSAVHGVCSSVLITRVFLAVPREPQAHLDEEGNQCRHSEQTERCRRSASHTARKPISHNRSTAGFHQDGPLGLIHSRLRCTGSHLVIGRR